MVEGRSFLTGLHQCSSVWCCPVCSGRICAERADEVKQLVAWHGPDRVWMASLTVRHELGDDALPMFKGVSRAWSKLVRGKPWKRFSARLGISGYVRAFETTIGPNGWHPHLHVLLLVDHAATSAGDVSPDFERDHVAAGGDPLLDPKLVAAHAWLRARWQDCVEEVLGPEHRPNDRRALELTPCRVADYIAKLGLELAGVAKEGRGSESRTPWQLARDVVDRGAARDVALWESYQRATHGRRHITWSRGLKVRAGIEERDDAEIVELEAEEPAALVYVITGNFWDSIRGVPRATSEILSGAELRGPAGVRDALVSIVGRRLHVSPRAGPAPPPVYAKSFGGGGAVPPE